MVRIARARLDGEMLVKSLRVIVFGMNKQRPGTDCIRCLRRPQQRILEERWSDPFPL